MVLLLVDVMSVLENEDNIMLPQKKKNFLVVLTFSVFLNQQEPDITKIKTCPDD